MGQFQTFTEFPNDYLDTGDKMMTKGTSQFLSEINNNRDANIESDNYMCQLELKVTLMNIGVKHS